MMILYNDKWQDFEDVDAKMTMLHIILMMMLYTWYIHLDDELYEDNEIDQQRLMSSVNQ